MNEPEPISDHDRRGAAPVFISYATADRKKALKVCDAIERGGTPCWISCRDVPPGENYQEAIVRQIRTAPAMVLVFSSTANNSDEIKKELSLVSRYKVPVLALRIEEVEPSDAFAYELSTRQWIDAYKNWDNAIDAVLHRIAQVSSNERAVSRTDARGASQSHAGRAVLLSGLALGALVLAGVAAWFLFGSSKAEAHVPEVRFAGFQRLSSDVPATMPDLMREEMIAAFTHQAVVAISTAGTPAPGATPSYALGGTVFGDGKKIRVTVKLWNERSGTTLWSNTFSYDRTATSRAPRAVALKAGNLARCGLFGASTYVKPLPDAVLINYLQYCHNSGLIEWQPTRALDFAKKVVAALPDYSWGWSAVEIGSLGASMKAEAPAEVESLRSQGLAAADKAIALDATNSEALTYKSRLIDQNDLVGREKLLKAALAARPLACACEHHLYAALLEEVGRNAEAIREYRRALDVLALSASAEAGLYGTLLVAGKAEEAEKHLEAYVDFAGADPSARAEMRLYGAAFVGDARGALSALQDPALTLPPPIRSAATAAFTALRSDSLAAKAAAASQILAIDPKGHRALQIYLLALLGRPADSLRVVERTAVKQPYVRSQLFTPALSSARVEPSFAGTAARLGLLRYWRQTRTKPDFCFASAVPKICMGLGGALPN